MFEIDQISKRVLRYITFQETCSSALFSLHIDSCPCNITITYKKSTISIVVNEICVLEYQEKLQWMMKFQFEMFNVSFRIHDIFACGMADITLL